MSYQILYHNNCPDGFTAAWSINRWLEAEGLYPCLVPMDYSMDAPNVEGAHVIMVDFCFDAVEKMVQIIDQASSFLLLDHHKTGLPWFKENPFYKMIRDADKFGMYESFDELDEDAGSIRVLSTGEVRICIDINHSGAVLAGLYTGDLVTPTWELDSMEFLNEFMYYVEDRDLWRFALPGSQKFTAYLGSFDYSLGVWDDMAQIGAVANGIHEGVGILRFRNQLVQQMVKLAQSAQLDEFEIVGAPSPYMVGSDVAGELAKISPSKIGAYWIDGPGYLKVGLRSTEDGPDVAEICARFGGNGHAHAAGFSLPSSAYELYSQAPDFNVPPLKIKSKLQVTAVSGP